MSGGIVIGGVTSYTPPSPLVGANNGIFVDPGGILQLGAPNPADALSIVFTDDRYIDLDGFGFYIVDQLNAPNSQVRFSAGQVFISTDGGGLVTLRDNITNTSYDLQSSGFDLALANQNGFASMRIFGEVRFNFSETAASQADRASTMFTIISDSYSEMLCLTRTTSGGSSFIFDLDAAVSKLDIREEASGFFISIDASTELLDLQTGRIKTGTVGMPTPSAPWALGDIAISVVTGVDPTQVVYVEVNGNVIPLAVAQL